ncbi:MAG: hypothetical protein M3R41_06420 [Pseudomonadota bacterium]|nr:hypothetical protein [Pseudomonadota bacterium]
MTDENRDTDAFAKLIESLDIQLSQSADGVYTVCSTQEPLFCFDGDSREELGVQVVRTLVSYAKHFLQIDVTGGVTEAQPIAASPLPVERSTPVARLKPVFDLAA